MRTCFVIVGVDNQQSTLVLGNERGSLYSTEVEANRAKVIAEKDYPQYTYVVLPVQGGPRIRHQRAHRLRKENNNEVH